MTTNNISIVTLSLDELAAKWPDELASNKLIIPGKSYTRKDLEEIKELLFTRAGCVKVELTEAQKKANLEMFGYIPTIWNGNQFGPHPVAPKSVQRKGIKAIANWHING